MSLTDAIKKLSTNAVNAGNPVSVILGTVVTIDPLSVVVDQRFTLTEDFLILPERLTRYEVDLKHFHKTSGEDTQNALLDKVVIREGLKPNDGVLLLRIQGGHEYVVWDKVASE